MVKNGRLMHGRSEIEIREGIIGIWFFYLFILFIYCFYFLIYILIYLFINFVVVSFCFA